MRPKGHTFLLRPKLGIPKLSPAEYAMLMNIDRIPTNDRVDYEKAGKRKFRRSEKTIETTYTNGQKEYFYVEGEPLEGIIVVGEFTANRIRRAHAKGAAIAALVDSEDLRPEWIQTILDNPKQSKFRFGHVAD